MNFHLNASTQWEEGMQYNRETTNTAANLSTEMAMLTSDSESKPFLCFIPPKNSIVFYNFSVQHGGNTTGPGSFYSATLEHAGSKCSCLLLLYPVESDWQCKE